VHQWPALQSRKHRGVDLLGDGLVVRQHHAAARAAERLVSGGRHDMRMAEGRWVLARGDEPGKVGHVHQQHRSDLVANAAESAEVEMARIG
jgi:hypothetical protein